MRKRVMSSFRKRSVARMQRMKLPETSHFPVKTDSADYFHPDFSEGAVVVSKWLGNNP